MLRTATILDWSDGDWNFAFLCDALPPDIYQDLANGLGAIEWQEASTHFYTQYESNLASNDCYRRILNPIRLSAIRAMTEDFFGCLLEEEIEVVAHKLTAGQQIGMHTDRNSLGESHRLTVHLNPGWSYSQGGVLLALRERNVAAATHAWLPLANTAFMFEIGPRSFHAVTSVVGRTPRYSIVFTFRTSQPHAPIGIPVSRRLPFPLLSQLRSAGLAGEQLGIGAGWIDSGFRPATRDEIFDLLTQNSSPSRNVCPPADCAPGPIIAVQRYDGRLVVVEGLTRLLEAQQKPDDVPVLIFRQPPFSGP